MKKNRGKIFFGLVFFLIIIISYLVDLNEIFKDNSTIFIKHKPTIEKKITKINVKKQNIHE